MTGLAQRLRREGHDVRFYAGRSFAGRLERLGVPHVPFRRAAEINGQNLAGHFPEIDKLKGPKRVAFDVEKIFFAPIPAHYADITGDCRRRLPVRGAGQRRGVLRGLPGHPQARHAPGVRDSPGTDLAKSAGAPPPFFGLTPATLAAQAPAAYWAMVEGTAKRARPILDELLAREGLPAYDGSIYQLPWDTVDPHVRPPAPPRWILTTRRWPDDPPQHRPLLPPRTGQGQGGGHSPDRLATAAPVVVVYRRARVATPATRRSSESNAARARGHRAPGGRLHRAP